jgi:hypothetical protein
MQCDAIVSVYIAKLSCQFPKIFTSHLQTLPYTTHYVDCVDCRYSYVGRNKQLWIHSRPTLAQQNVPHASLDARQCIRVEPVGQERKQAYARYAAVDTTMSKLPPRVSLHTPSAPQTTRLCTHDSTPRADQASPLCTRHTPPTPPLRLAVAERTSLPRTHLSRLGAADVRVRPTYYIPTHHANTRRPTREPHPHFPLPRTPLLSNAQTRCR